MLGNTNQLPAQGSGVATEPVSSVDSASATSSIAAVVAEVCELLRSAGVSQAEVEARDIVTAVCGLPRYWPILNPEAEITSDAMERSRMAARRRARGAPLAYATRVANFRFLELFVDERVLIPRPETEHLVELVLRETGRAGGIVADIGTGSGAVALALASEGHYRAVVATDVSEDALAVAAINAERLASTLRAPVEFRRGAGVAPLLGSYVDVLVSNPPYISLDEASELPRSVRDWEPAVALFSSGGGLAVTAELVCEAPTVLRPGGLLALECDSRRASRVAALVEEVGAYTAVRVEPDLTGRSRFVLARRLGVADAAADTVATG
jgi:release factor glutamine methyltransferase